MIVIKADSVESLDVFFPLHNNPWHLENQSQLLLELLFQRRYCSTLTYDESGP